MQIILNQTTKIIIIFSKYNNLCNHSIRLNRLVNTKQQPECSINSSLFIEGNKERCHYLKT